MDHHFGPKLLESLCGRGGCGWVIWQKKDNIWEGWQRGQGHMPNTKLLPGPNPPPQSNLDKHQLLSWHRFGLPCGCFWDLSQDKWTNVSLFQELEKPKIFHRMQQMQHQYQCIATQEFICPVFAKYWTLTNVLVSSIHHTEWHNQELNPFIFNERNISFNSGVQLFEDVRYAISQFTGFICILSTGNIWAASAVLPDLANVAVKLKLYFS